jgi:hypothetical protein
MQIFRAALGAALVASSIAAPTRHERAANVPIGLFSRGEKPCAIAIPGYDAPYCDNTLSRAGTYKIVEKESLPLDKFDPTLDSGVGNPQVHEVRQAAKQKGAGALSKFKRCLGVHEDGKPFPTAAEWATYGTHGSYSDKLTCSIETGHHRSYISGPHSCAELCDLDENCQGFASNSPHCLMFNTPETYLLKGASAEYANRILADPTSNAVVTKAAKAGMGNLGPRMYFKSSLNSKDICQSASYFSKPCVPFDGYLWGEATEIDVSAMDDKLTWGSDDTEWLGTAPAEFKSTNVQANSIAALYAPGATYSAADPDCGCEYGKWTTGIKSGAAVGYGFYETKLKTTATEFSNVFWMQGEDAEINILKVTEADANSGKGKATVSWHCFDAQGSTESEESSEFEVDIANVVTAGLLFTEAKLEVIVNNVVVYTRDTPTCMQGKTMKPIFSVEAGNTLPTESATSDGEMTISYLRKWTPTVPAAGGADYLCDSVYSAGTTEGNVQGVWKTCNDKTYKDPTTSIPTAGSHCKHLGPYEGLAAGRHYEKGLCGLSALRKRQHKLLPPAEYSSDYRVRGEPSRGAEACDATDSCVAVHYYPPRLGANGVAQLGFSMLMGSGTTRTDEGSYGILFLRKNRVDDNCVDDDLADDFNKVCNERGRTSSKYWRCPVPIPGQTDNFYFREPAAYVASTKDYDEGGKMFPDLKAGYKTGYNSDLKKQNPVDIEATYAECKQFVLDSRAIMRKTYADSMTDTTEGEIPEHWLCNQFAWKADTSGQSKGRCAPMLYTTTSTEGSGQMDFSWDTWNYNGHNIKL